MSGKRRKKGRTRRLEGRTTSAPKLLANPLASQNFFRLDKFLSLILAHPTDRHLSWLSNKAQATILLPGTSHYRGACDSDLTPPAHRAPAPVQLSKNSPASDILMAEVGNDDNLDVPTLYSSYPYPHHTDRQLSNMAEVTFAKQFLAALDARPVKLSPDHVEDPKGYPARSAVSFHLRNHQFFLRSI